ALDHIALDVVFESVGVDDLAAVVNDRELGHADYASCAVYLDLCDGANISAHQLIFHVGHATSLRDIANCAFLRRRPLLPFGELRQPVEQFESTLVIEILPTELERIHVGGW